MSSDLKGLDYFPTDTALMKNYQIQLIRRSYGAEGFLFYMTLLCDIYATGYYLRADEIYLYHLSGELRMDEARLREMLDFLVDRDVFDRTLYETHGVISSVWIQEQYFLITSRRVLRGKSQTMPYILIRNEEEAVEAESVTLEIAADSVIESEVPTASEPPAEVVSVAETPVYAAESTQRKENKTKVNNSSSSSSAREAICLTERLTHFGQELLTSEIWQHALVKAAGRGGKILELAPDVLPCFDAHLVLQGGFQDDACSLRNYARWFINWWRCLNFRPADQIDPERVQTVPIPAPRSNGRSHINPVSKVQEAMRIAEEVEWLMAHQAT